MLDTVFRGLFDSVSAREISVTDFLLCIICSLVIGLMISLFYMYRERTTSGFVMTLAILPAVICVVIMVVNGNIGAGVAVAGAFSLIRFRSAPGSAREIGAIFLCMGAGLLAGMGYLAYAFLFAIIMCLITFLYRLLNLGGRKRDDLYKTLRITIPEDLDYTTVFEDIFSEYTDSWELIQVRTTNMGSLFRLTYNIRLRSGDVEKTMIDSLRCRNGNLEISVSRQETVVTEQL